MTSRPRLAFAARIVVANAFAFLTLASCAEPSSNVDGLEPAPGADAGLTDTLAISPQNAHVLPGQQLVFTAPSQTVNGTVASDKVTWSATGGSIDTNGVFMSISSGTYTVTANRGTKKGRGKVTVGTSGPTITALAISPRSLGLGFGAQYKFAATGTASDGSSVPVAVAWSASGGTIDTSGTYRAGNTAGTYRVVATEQGGTLSDTSVVTLSTAAPTLQGVDLTPATITLAPGATQQFAAAGRMSDGSTSSIAVTWSATGGTVSSSGWYTAGQVAGSYRVIAASGSFADTTVVTVSTPPASVSLTGVLLTPASVTLAPGATQQFSAVGRMSDGSTTSVSVTWAATGGTVTAAGVYTAGSTIGSYRIIAASGGFADTSTVTVSAPAPSLTGVTLTPASVSLWAGSSQQFTAVGRMSDGSTSSIAVTWSATGGTVSSSGWYTAGQAAGSYRVIAASGSFADTTVVTVNVRSLTSLTVSPKSVSLASGASQQYAVAATWSDGTTSLPSITWSGLGGTISSSGWYTAGSASGTYRVIASGGGKADTAVVQITAPAPTLTGIVLSPATVSLQAAGAQQFSVVGNYSDGSTGGVSVTYAATGGTVSASGLYTAGQVAGTFAVIATCACGRADTSAVTVAASGGGGGAGVPSLGLNASLNGWRPFPDDNPWNTPVDGAPVDPNSAAIIANMAPTANLYLDWGFPPYNNPAYGIPYIVVSGSQAKVPLTFTAYGYESDPGPYPIPANAPIEGTTASDPGSDRHVLVLDRDNKKLYELNGASNVNPDGSWTARNGAVFDLTTNALRPLGWTSADAAGLPIFPGLIRLDEVLGGEIRHALRFTTGRTRRAYVLPATHYASSITDANYPPMGARLRLKASVDISRFSPQMQVILRALQKYGMFVADNGAYWSIQGVTDGQGRWAEGLRDEMTQIKGSDFEIVKMGTVYTQ